MSVMTPARTRTAGLHLADLDPATRAGVEDAFEDIRLAANPVECDLAQHVIAAHLGITLPASGELALCTCPVCGCDAIEDVDHVATHQPGDGTETVQCRTCADDHRTTE